MVYERLYSEGSLNLLTLSTYSCGLTVSMICYENVSRPYFAHSYPINRCILLLESKQLCAPFSVIHWSRINYSKWHQSVWKKYFPRGLYLSFGDRIHTVRIAHYLPRVHFVRDIPVDLGDPAKPNGERKICHDVGRSELLKYTSHNSIHLIYAN